MTTYLYPVRHLFIMFALLEAVEKKGRMVTAAETFEVIKSNPEKYGKINRNRKYGIGNIGHVLSKEIKEHHIIKRDINRERYDSKRKYKLTKEGEEYIKNIMERWGV